MAFALLSRARSKTQDSVKPVPKRRSARRQHSTDSRSGFVKPVFQPYTVALPTVPVIQTKLQIGEPNDKLEQEADQVAELRGNGGGPILPSAVARSRSPVGSLQRLYGNQAVLQPLLPLRPSQSGILQRKCARGGAAGMSGECEECRKKGEGMLQRAFLSSRGRETEGEGEVPPIVHEVLRSPGQPLDPAPRTFMESRFGHDFSSVRVHTDQLAARSAAAVAAHAYTVGSDMVFGSGRYAPASRDGQRLLAHELTHVAQQAGAPGSRRRAGSGVAVQRDKLPTIPRTTVTDRIAELKAQNTNALGGGDISVLELLNALGGGGDIPVLELLEALQRAVRKSKPAEITRAVDAFLKGVDEHPLQAATQALIGNVGDDIVVKLVAKGLTDEADRILAHFHSATSSYELPNIFGTTTSSIAQGSGFFPDASKGEGGFKDRFENPLHTLQDFQASKAPFVSVAMDKDNGPPFGTRLSIDEFPGVVFRVVDTGDAFVGKGLTRIDICTADKKASLDPKINGPLHLRFAIPLSR